MINKYSINMLFWDQWDFLGGLFEKRNLWELFIWQHGPHRQGVGFFLTKIVADFSNWNTRVECFMIGIVLCFAALTAIFLKRKISGTISAFDVLIPLLYLSPLQFELFANTPNVSHGAMPLLLITLFCLCWTINNILLRYITCAAINFMTIYTGFGVFIGCITPFLFLSEFVLAVKQHNVKKRVLSIIFCIIAVSSMLSFFIDYTFNSAAAGFVFPHPKPFMYVQFILIAFSTYCGIRMSNIILYIISTPIVLYMVYVAIKSGLSIMRNVSNEKTNKEILTGQIVIMLITFTFVFSLNLAIGRVCLGLGAATVSRYLPYMTPGFFALYLFAVAKKDVPIRLISLGIACFFITTFSIGNHNRIYAQKLISGKQKWKQAYLKTENLLFAYKASGFTIHPNPHDTKLKWKLDYLKKNRLNLYLDAAK
ncbi:hypothetical protein VU08_07975 [Desulfobulbus sp. F5]|nr:hypothetical protein [Desulfobulbus sp. F5]